MLNNADLNCALPQIPVVKYILESSSVTNFLFTFASIPKIYANWETYYATMNATTKTLTNVLIQMEHNFYAKEDYKHVEVSAMTH